MRTTSKANKSRVKLAAVAFSFVMVISSIAPSYALMQDLKATSVPIEIPLVMGYADGNEVFYITTEASHEEVADHLTELTGFRVVYTPALKNTPKAALANIYEFTNGVEGSGPAGFQPNVADSQPGDPEYSPAWAVQHVTWLDESIARELTSEEEILAAKDAGELTIQETGVVVNCPFIQWERGSLPIREDGNLTDESPYGGGQVLNIDTENMLVTFVAHRGFGPDGTTVYYIATDASSQEVADMLGVIYVEKIGNTLVSSAASDLYVFTNGITGSGPAGFQASIGSTQEGDEFYSPFWRIQMASWADPESAEFLTTLSQITEAASNEELVTQLGGFIVNCPFVEVPIEVMMESPDHMEDKMEDKMEDTMMEHVMPPKMQMDEGVAPQDVVCNEGLELLLKSSDGSAVCVKPNTAELLLSRGWAVLP
ncbi:MAG: hypothetical protein AB1608_11305 [Thermoproteota archaeon]